MSESQEERQLRLIDEGGDHLEHFGVKGMRWGVRKDDSGGGTPEKSTIKSRYRELKNKPTETVTFKSSKGVDVTLKETPVPALGAAIGATNKRFAKVLRESRSFDVHVGGEKVGDIAIRAKSKDELYLNWMGIDDDHRGKGYASAIFDTGISYGKANGFSKMTLEVPGNAPDARHIYEKRGFKQSGPMMGNKRDMWGGLTPMTLDLKEGR